MTRTRQRTSMAHGQEQSIGEGMPRRTGTGAKTPPLHKGTRRSVSVPRSRQTDVASVSPPAALRRCIQWSARK